jgi:alpha-galactosidase
VNKSLFFTAALFATLAASPFDADLTGNWVSAEPLADGTSRRLYFDLKQEGSTITGHIRQTQFYYTITESSGGPDGFTIVGTMREGNSVRKVEYQGKLIGDELDLSTQRRPDAPLIHLVAHRAIAGEGAMPARLALPALHNVPYNGLAKTPPMGWNSWNKFASKVDDAGVRASADAIASNGMKEAGYVYVNIDDTWEGERDALGNIHSNKKFPDMKALADYVHSKGLKIGIYSSPGPNTCAGYEGSYGHEEQDAHTWAEWGIDYLKYDWCGARNLYTNDEMQAVYQKMGDALLKSGRCIVYSLCQYGLNDVWKWGPSVGGNLWRTRGDISDRWESMSRIGFRQSDLAPYAAPGHWNDPDMLEIGNGGMTNTEYRTHMSLWSILAAPLLAGNDLQHVSPEVLSILTNRELIAVDQDKLGKQGSCLLKSGDQQVWVKELTGGAKAIGLFNLAGDTAKVSFTWSAAGFSEAPRHVRDLWLHRDLQAVGPDYSAEAPSHGVVMLRVSN